MRKLANSSHWLCLYFRLSDSIGLNFREKLAKLYEERLHPSPRCRMVLMRITDCTAPLYSAPGLVIYSTSLMSVDFSCNNSEEFITLRLLI